MPFKDLIRNTPVYIPPPPPKKKKILSLIAHVLFSSLNMAVPPDPPQSIQVTHTSSTTFTIAVKEPLNNGGLRVEGYQVGFRTAGFGEDYQDFNGKRSMYSMCLSRLSRLQP